MWSNYLGGSYINRKYSDDTEYEHLIELSENKIDAPVEA